MRPRHLGPVGHDRTRDDWPQEFRASRIFEGFQAAAERVDQAVASRIISEIRTDLVREDIVDDVRKDAVGRGAFIGYMGGHVLDPFGYKRALLNYLKN